MNHSTALVVERPAVPAGDSGLVGQDRWTVRRAQDYRRNWAPARRSDLQQKRSDRLGKDPERIGRSGTEGSRSCQSRWFAGVVSSRKSWARQAAASLATHQAQLVFC